MSQPAGRTTRGAAVLVTLAAMIVMAVPTVRSQPAAAHHIIFDTDFALPPQDDGLALAFALNSPELDIVGITTVAGNYNLARANADVLRMLEIATRGDVKVYGGARRPLAHEKDTFATSHYGKWWSDDPAPAPPGGFAKKALEPMPAAEFMARTVMARPGQIEILAIGPLTNVATAIQQQPAFARAVKRIMIMGGAIASLPDGGGNITPNAEFNFWVDPEAARIVLRSGIPIVLSPLNVSVRTSFDRESFRALTASVTPITRLIDAQMRPRYESNPDFHPHMYDEVAAASLVDPTLVKTKRMVVDVDATHGINYGVSVGGAEVWPGAEGARTIDVQYDIDNARFMRLFVERVAK
ncbi:MAG: nucleoside hydrolase [Acidobacteria bacterium]|nr:nucleoside hydrolase [Acidobacteriota bacterium]